MKTKTKKIITTFLVLALLCISAFIGWRLLVRTPEVEPEVVPTEAPTPTATPTPTPTATPTPTPTPEPTVPQVINFPDYWEINPDVFAYIEIPDTVVSYPILQSTIQEENYYLNTTIDGRQGYPGSIYAQLANMKDFSDYMTVLFGHNMRDGSYFGALRQYAYADFYEEHRTIMIYHPGYQFTYKIIAQAVVPEDYLTVFDVRDPKTPFAVLDGLKDATAHDSEMLVSEDDPLQQGDKILVLYSCVGSREVERRIVIAKLIERIKTDPQYVQPVRTPTPTPTPTATPT